MAKDYYVWMLPVRVKAETATEAINRTLGKGGFEAPFWEGPPPAVAIVATTERPIVAPSGQQQRGSSFLPYLETQFVHPIAHEVDREAVFNGTLGELTPFASELQILEVETQLEETLKAEEMDAEIPF